MPMPDHLTNDAAGEHVGNLVTTTLNTIHDVGEADGALAKAGEVLEGIGEGVDDLGALLASLHVIDKQLADHGSSVVQMLSSFARAFHGIHL